MRHWVRCVNHTALRQFLKEVPVLSVTLNGQAIGVPGIQHISDILDAPL
jgi:hypothetical protein